MSHRARLSPVTPPPPVLAVTVLGDDRPGIVAELTEALAGVGGNLEDSTMTLLRGHFAMVVLVRSDASQSAVEAAMQPLQRSGGLSVDVRSLPDPAQHSDAGQSSTLRVHGADRPGIVASITRVLARHGGNIVDLGTRLGSALYVLLAEVVLPEGADVSAVQADLADAARGLGVDVSLHPVDDDLL